MKYEYKNEKQTCFSYVEIYCFYLYHNIFLVNTLMIGKPEKGRLVENLILQMAQTRQIMSKLNEEELIGLIEKVNKQFGCQQKTTVKV